jgi:hypothetical protein
VCFDQKASGQEIMIAHVAPGTKRKTGEIGQSEKERKREEGKSKGEIKDCHGRIC